MTAPEMVRFVKQDGESLDCAIATVAMLCGVTYTQALTAFPKPSKVLESGAYLTELQAAAKKLNVKTKIKKRFDVDEDTGILYVSGKDEHLVFLWAGRIIEGNGECWLNPASYLATYKYKAKSLVVVVES